ncbi:CvfB family protein [Fulvivirga lutea]|uniref:GntR family transcriptional regulator n=1 Tax=Fulvivirga lutea TaxID=2810512 RepID=A0A974WEJ8_9BACT|nr:S1-like domain-containing RNA-binding protein [Fulvivirga lutea]QSE96661.1 GntR family transcriptional regulator [Fulvivirga lutea]
MTIGEFYELEILREVDFGMYLKSDLGDVLLPIKYVPDGYKVGDFIRVFLHRDSEDRLLATTLEPFGKLNDFVALQVKDKAPHGAFMDWGLEKDLFVPIKEQPRRYEIGDIQVVRICLDHKTDRLLGVGKLNVFLDKDTSQLNEGDPVDILVFDESDLGYQSVVNQRYSGLLYKNELFQPVRVGDELKGYISKVREDGKLDLRLNKVGVEAIDENTKRLIEALEKNGGELPLHDKSSPEEIQRELKMSKKAFKKALGGLYKSKKVELLESGIKLIH